MILSRFHSLFYPVSLAGHDNFCGWKLSAANGLTRVFICMVNLNDAVIIILLMFT